MERISFKNWDFTEFYSLYRNYKVQLITCRLILILKFIMIAALHGHKLMSNSGNEQLPHFYQYTKAVQFMIWLNLPLRSTEHHVYLL